MSGVRGTLLCPWKTLVREPGFVVAALVLLLSAVGLAVGTRVMTWYFRKEAIPLKNPLESLAVSRLGPYRVVERFPILDKSVEEALGAHDYIQWQLEDTSVDEDSDLRFINFFVTYYTGQPEYVLHIPDICYTGSGGQVVSREELEITVPDNGTGSDTIPVRYLEVASHDLLGERRHGVCYFFSVNGHYSSNRQMVRYYQNDLSFRHSYYSKVEFGFPYSRDLSRDAIVAATEKVSRWVVPVLVSDHWPEMVAR